MANILLENWSCTSIVLRAYQHHSQISQTAVCLILQDIFFPQSEKSCLIEFPAMILYVFKASFVLYKHNINVYVKHFLT